MRRGCGTGVITPLELSREVVGPLDSGEGVSARVDNTRTGLKMEFLGHHMATERVQPFRYNADSRVKAECEEGTRLSVLDEKEVKEQARLFHEQSELEERWDHMACLGIGEEDEGPQTVRGVYSHRK